MTSYGIVESSFKKIIELLSANKKISEAFLFGSRAKGSFHEGSDIDIALKGDFLSRDDLLNLQLAYEELDLPWKLDLLIYSQISDPDIKAHIDRNGKKII